MSDQQATRLNAKNNPRLTADLPICMATAVVLRPPVDTSLKPVLWRLLPNLVIMVILLIVGAGALLWQQHQQRIADNIANLISEVHSNLHIALDQQASGMAAVAQLIAADTNVQKALRQGDANSILTTWQPLFEMLHRQNKLTHFYFFDTNRVCLLRVHKPEIRGDLINRFTALEAERTVKTASGIELGPLGTFTLRVVQPVFESGTLVGYVELGKEIEEVLQTVHDHDGLELVVTIRKEYLNRQSWEEGMRLLGREAEWDRLPHNVVIYASQGRLPDAFASIADHDPAGDRPHRETDREITFDGKGWRASATPLQDASGTEVGCLEVMRDISTEKAAFVRLLALGGTGGAVLLALLIGFIYALLHRTDASIRAQLAALQKSEEKHRFLIENNHDIIYTLTAEGIFTFVSPALTALLGYPVTQVVGQTIQQFVHPDDLPGCMVFLQSVIETGQRQDGVEYRVQHIDGSWYWHTTSAVPLRDEAGMIVGLEGTSRDITERKRAEDALKFSLSLLSTSLESTADGLLIVNREGKVTRYNQKFAAMWKIPEDVIASNDDNMLLNHVIAQVAESGQFLAKVREIYSKPEEFSFDQVAFADGRVFERYSQPQKIGNNVVGRVWSFRDITERKLAEEALREREEKYRNLFNNAEVGIYRTRFDGSEVLEINRRFLDIVGMTVEETLGKPSVNLWADPKEREEMVKRLIADGSVSNFEYKMLNKRQGDVRNCLTSLRLYREQGLLEGSILDITERKLAEVALQESEEKFRNVADQSFVGIYIIQDRIFKYVNPKFSEIFGFTVEQCLGLSFDKLVYPEDQNTVEENVRKRLAGEVKTVHYEFRGVRKNKEIVYLEIFGSSTRFNGKTAATGTLLDITERKKAEEEKVRLESRLMQAQKMESIGSLAGGIAHDLNNILFPITGLSEMLLDEIPQDNPAHENIEQIYKSAQRGSDLVKQILAFSRQSSPKKLPIRIPSVLKEALKLARASIPMNIEITSRIKPDCGMVFADPTQIHQIAMNLITNAYHAVEKTGGAINLELKETAIRSFGEKDELSFHAMPGDLLADRYACITISDTGTGMDQTLIDKIFDPYFTTKELGKGTGLGLSVVHGIVKEHGGDIRVYSEVGKGTAFHVYLPLLEDARDSKTAAVTRKYPTGRESILLVDDEEPILRMEQMMLERLGYKVTIRMSSPDALAAFNANPSNFDLVISDRGMPNMTGEQLARELISIRPGIPIILCTGFSDENDEKRAMDRGVKGFLKKPVATGDLAEMVRKVLDDAAGSELAKSSKEKP